jgi:GTP-binding protein EngB required for normal cell division
MGDASEHEGYVALDSTSLDQLNNAEARALLDTIDSLRELQIGDIVNLPQIIVVGDQSSGKSSVLEAISRVRFPVKGDLCTRFATELVLRRASETSIEVTIRFANGIPTPGYVEGRSGPFRRSGFDRNALPEIIEKAEEHMGIVRGNTKGFSKDVLRIEIAGPDVFPLTLVDLPGFFHAGTSTQSTEGKQIVDQLVESYMKQKNSIILAVVSANQQLAGQKVLAEAKRHDPTRERTVGVITKPDVPRPGSTDQRNAVQLAKNEESAHVLTLGWHVLRNRSEEEETIEADERDANETLFFETGAWAHISPANRGAGNLRKKLSRVLLEHIQRSLPELIVEIETSLRTRQAKLEQLGKPRSSPAQLRSYLIDISETFQRLARDAVDGRYGDAFFGNIYEDERKLRARLRNLNRAFDVILRTKGADREIEWDADIDQEFNGRDEDSSSEHDAFPEYLRPYVDLYKFPDPETVTESKIKSELELLAAANQGKEFPGLPKGEVAVQFFRMQAKPWQEIAEFHLNLVTEFAKAFVERLFNHIVGTDVDTTNAILRLCVDPFFDAIKDRLEAKLIELLRPYTNGYGLPLETEFLNRFSKRSMRRLAGQVTDILQEKFPANIEGKGQSLSRKKLLQTIASAEDLESSELGTEKVIDMSVAYYDVRISKPASK